MCAWKHEQTTDTHSCTTWLHIKGQGASRCLLTWHTIVQTKEIKLTFAFINLIITVILTEIWSCHKTVRLEALVALILEFRQGQRPCLHSRLLLQRYGVIILSMRTQKSLVICSHANAERRRQEIINNRKRQDMQFLILSHFDRGFMYPGIVQEGFWWNVSSKEKSAVTGVLGICWRCVYLVRIYCWIVSSCAWIFLSFFDHPWWSSVG